MLHTILSKDGLTCYLFVCARAHLWVCACVCAACMRACVCVCMLLFFEGGGGKGGKLYCPTHNLDNFFIQHSLLSGYSGIGYNSTQSTGAEQPCFPTRYFHCCLRWRLTYAVARLGLSDSLEDDVGLTAASFRHSLLLHQPEVTDLNSAVTCLIQSQDVLIIISFVSWVI